MNGARRDDGLKISIVLSDFSHPCAPYLSAWIDSVSEQHSISLVSSVHELERGDILFLISCNELVSREVRGRFNSCLVIHASDLPEGRGWSPYVWDIVEGKEELTISLIEADEPVDSGKIWKKVKVFVPRHALWNEICAAVFTAQNQLLSEALRLVDVVMPTEQDPLRQPTYRQRRTPDDSRIDPYTPIIQQFDLLRACDPHRFPAFFDLYGHRYILTVRKDDR